MDHPLVVLLVDNPSSSLVLGGVHSATDLVRVASNNATCWILTVSTVETVTDLDSRRQHFQSHQHFLDCGFH